mmetsp:Transcript_32237/g.94247  ORF Transcript_32237/g.94247 Transcript_32237/m.94247 type:complete len:239 (-) Transcript_32237:747-1463(-)
MPPRPPISKSRGTCRCTARASPRSRSPFPKRRCHREGPCPRRPRHRSRNSPAPRQGPRWSSRRRPRGRRRPLKATGLGCGHRRRRASLSTRRSPGQGLSAVHWCPARDHNPARRSSLCASRSRAQTPPGTGQGCAPTHRPRPAGCLRGRLGPRSLTSALRNDAKSAAWPSRRWRRWSRTCRRFPSAKRRAVGRRLAPSSPHPTQTRARAECATTPAARLPSSTSCRCWRSQSRRPGLA